MDPHPHRSKFGEELVKTCIIRGVGSVGGHYRSQDVSFML